MNIDVYKALGSKPIQMKCPGLDEAKAAQTQVNTVIQKLQALGLDEMQEIDMEVINVLEDKLSLVNTSVDNTMGHMQNLSDNAMWFASKSNLVSTLDTMAGFPVAPCVNTSALFGPINGVAAEIFSKVDTLAQTISIKIESYLSGALDAIELELYLSGVGELIDDTTAKFDKMVADGKALIDEFEQKVMNSSIASAIDALWSNPCTQSILDATLPDDIKQHLPS
ncbi:hypothetical protein [Vibrio sp. Sgm 5]|uniref:hypothetical protein n=1 Tax=Vibrio sp. Sgm 5 TaxID=2994387 RepID=UPI00224968E9|nr:hypothetical protein [Vibrio sp. Sgm 5]MCX2788352.1 hypothetical protein [Vibrio sp. Sgm 5]